MPRENKILWLEYTGQDTEQIFACKDTHRVDSLLCALEQAIQLRQDRIPDHAITSEENTLLAIRALEREVNNGGYDQFFVNSSVKYAPAIVAALKSASCHEIAALTQKAIDALDLPSPTVEAIKESIFQPNEDRDEALNDLDQQFYQIFEIEPKLFAFVESHQQAFVLGKMHVAPRPPRRGNRNHQTQRPP